MRPGDRQWRGACRRVAAGVHAGPSRRVTPVLTVGRGGRPAAACGLGRMKPCPYPRGRRALPALGGARPSRRVRRGARVERAAPPVAAGGRGGCARGPTALAHRRPLTGRLPGAGPPPRAAGRALSAVPCALRALHPRPPPGGARAGVAAGAGVALVAAAAGWYAYTETHAVLEPAAYAALRPGTPLSARPARPADPGPADGPRPRPPEGADCRYHRASGELFVSADHYRLCFDDEGRLVARDVVPRGRPAGRRPRGVHAMVRVLPADDEAMVRAGVRALLDSGGEVEVVAETGDGREAVEPAACTAPTWPRPTSACPAWTGSRPPRRSSAPSPARPSPSSPPFPNTPTWHGRWPAAPPASC